MIGVGGDTHRYHFVQKKSCTCKTPIFMFMSAQRAWSGKPSLPEKVDNLHHDTHYLQLGLKPKKAWLCLTSFVVHPSVVCCLCTKMYVFNEQICPVLFLLERLFGCMYVCVSVCVCWLNRLSHIFLLFSVAILFSSLWWLQLSWGPRNIFTLWKEKKKTYICSVEISVSFFITDSGALLLIQPLKQVPWKAARNNTRSAPQF